jgi:DNA repair protein SbcC/Rad50
MLIRSVKLENIRSYTNQEIEFPEGSVLLSGDIGCGKSTILSAIEFALFGIKRKELSGAALLRHGKKQGSVELNFEIEEKKIIIKRNLKKIGDDIKQDSGYIIINGLKKEATALELKTIILDFLGFPKDLVSKTKDLVYRYTVYTPQEEMKQILSGDVESRLDILRRVFGIDKYKRIKANTFIIARNLKEKINIAQGKVDDLEEKQNSKKQHQEKIKNIDENLRSLLPSLNEIKERLGLKKQEISAIEKDIQESNRLKNELSVSNTELRNKQSLFKSNEEEIFLIKKEINNLQIDLGTDEIPNTEMLKNDIIKRVQKIELIELQIKDLSKIMSALESKKQMSEELKNKILKINQCPTCLQEVKEEHKMFISSREDEGIFNLDNQITGINVKKEELEKEFEMLKQGLEKVRKKESELSLIKVKLIHIDEKTKNLNRVRKENESLEEQIFKLKNIIKELNSKIENLKDSEQKYNIIKKEQEELNKKERSIEINQAGLIREKETLSNMLVSLEEEITKKLAIKEELKDLNEKENWLTKHFMNLVGLIEKHVMLKIHQEFNELFKEWFNLLIEDENLNARLDDSFTPIVEQDGYDTEFSSLSGGERTSLALAYRLSLNKVINDLITNIKMSDLLILDEPTDGFSTEQLDRVRLVLDQLGLKQIIIVSHESKMEGFVDNIIRIGKEDMMSKII